MTNSPTLMAISAVETVGLYIGVPGVLFGIIALIAYLTSGTSTDQTSRFPRLRRPDHGEPTREEDEVRRSAGRAPSRSPEAVQARSAAAHQQAEAQRRRQEQAD